MPPAVTDCDAGAAVSEKSAVFVPFMVSVAEAVCVKVPLAPATVSVKVPVVVVPVETVKVDEPEAPIDAGLKLAVAPLGKPLALNVTVPVNPFSGAAVTV